tara:strand:+ start:711 stop:1112 length:402 start_codon:yes stop_codon:yes gene_type:complete
VIIEDLAVLADSKTNVFDAESHQFKLHPVATEKQITTFERRHKVDLPEEYRTFLLEVGRGGAGPAYGLFNRGEVDDEFEHTKWRANGSFVGNLAKPFPHSKAWNDLSGQPAEELIDSDIDTYERELDSFEKRY